MNVRSPLRPGARTTHETPRRARLRAALALALAALACTAHAAASLYDFETPWRDDDGRLVSLAQWRHQPVLVAMEYSECRFICSAYWLEMQAIQREADRRDRRVEFLILSLDPEHDSPRSWQDYRHARGITRNNWHFLTADRGATNQAAAFLGVHWWYEESHLMHDFRIVRLDGDGHVASTMTSFDQPADLLLGAP